MPSDASSSFPSAPAPRGARQAVIALFALCSIGVLGGVAAAQQVTDAQRRAIRSACRSDFMAQCSGVTPGGREALACLRQHNSSLSAGCQKALAAAPGGSKTAAPDSGSSSSSATPEQTPSQQAAPAMTPREEMAIAREACGADFRAYCRAVPFGGGRVIACLRENMQRLSPSCQKVLSSAR